MPLGVFETILFELLAQAAAAHGWRAVRGSPDDRCTRASAAQALVTVATSLLGYDATPAQVRQVVTALENAIAGRVAKPATSSARMAIGGPAEALRQEIADSLQVLYEPIDNGGTTQANELGISVPADALTDQIIDALVSALAGNLAATDGRSRFLLDELRRMQETRSKSRRAPIQSRYLLCRSYEVMAELTQGNLESVPGKNLLLLPTPVMATWRTLLNECGPMRLPQCWGGAAPDKSTYLVLHPDAAEIDRSATDYPVFETRRSVTQRDVDTYVLPSDCFSRYLVEAGLAAEAIGEVFAYHELCGSRDPSKSFQERILLREPWALSLQVTALEDDVVLEDISGSTHPAAPLEVREQAVTENSAMRSGPFPQAALRRDESVLLPLATFIPPLGFEPVATYWTQLQKDTLGEWAPEVSDAHLGDSIANFLAIGTTLVATSIKVRDGSGTTRHVAVHRFDPSRVYVVGTKWFAGSCPHLFEVGNEELTYVGPVFGSEAGTVQTYVYDRSVRPALLLVELEEEVTWIKEIRQGDAVLVSDTYLSPGDSVVIPELRGSSPVIFVGSYHPLSEKVVFGATFERNRRVASFVKRSFFDTGASRS